MNTYELGLTKDLAEIFADDIELANSIDPQGWAVYSYKNRPVFGVSVYTLLSSQYRDGTFTFAVAGDRIPDEVWPELEPFASHGNHSRGGVLHLNIGEDVLRKYRGALIPAHRSILTELMSGKSRRWPWHNQEFIDVISQMTGRDLPSPSYIEDIETHGESKASGGYSAHKAEVSGYWLLGEEINLFEADLADGAVAERPWHDSLPDFGSLPEDRALFVQRMKQAHNVADQSAHRAWFFAYGMSVGDIVVLHTPRLPMKMAVGRVTGDYAFDDGQHTRTVEWLPPVPFEWNEISLDNVIGRRAPNWLTALSVAEIQRIIAKLPPEFQNLFSDEVIEAIQSPPTENEDAPHPEETSIPSLSDHYASRGLTYTDTQLAEFYTALQTKGFVVLSGISGTGKSKIAQHFTELLPNPIIYEAVGPDPVSTDEGLVMKLYENQIWAAVDSSQHQRFPRVPIGTKVDVRYMFDGGYYSGSYKIRVLAGGNPTLYFTMTEPLVTKIRQAVRDNHAYAQFRSASQGMPEVLVTAEPPELRIEEEFEEITISNTLFLSVRPDWRDGTALLGYYNPLTQTYEWTAFLRHILNAVENMESEDRVPWFIILDEMNLAHVEYYFADMLSVLESGRDLDGFTHEGLRLTYPDTITNDAPPQFIRLPPNLYVIGTVNMDETTHAFSPKVLDRAFTMELSDVDFANYQPGRVMANSELTDAEQHAMLREFTNHGWPTIDKQRIAAYIDQHPEVRRALVTLNDQLAIYRFHFGYRVFDEIVQFLDNAERNGMFPSLHSAFDSAVFMKVLPKFSGSEGRNGQPLAKLFAWASAPFGENSQPLTRTRDRVLYMQERLKEDGFVTAF